MNDARCIVIQPCEEWPEGLIPVESCLQCKFTIAGHSHCLAGDFNIKDFSQIHKFCPLLFYKKMRPHTPDEVPEGKRALLIIEIWTAPGIRNKPTISYAIGFGTTKGNFRIIGGIGLILKDNEKRKVLSWRYLEVK